MTLYLDCGNTRIKWRLDSEQGGVVEYAEFECWLAQQAAEHRVDRVVFASVLGESRRQWLLNNIARANLSAGQCIVTREALGVTCIYQQLERLGIDRWLVVVAAWVKLQSSCLVVDLGTAATLDIVDSQGRHQGGYIVPGLELALKGLLAGTDNIKPDPAGFDGASLLPGANTAQAVFHGGLASLVALIESIYSALLKSDPQAKLILTGGDARLVSRHLSLQHSIDDGVVFEGMRLLEQAGLLIDV